MANLTFLTRSDDGLGEGLYDSIAWAFEVHVGTDDRGDLNAALLYGNEDSPHRIEFYASADPLATDVPAFVWTAPTEDEDETARAKAAIVIGALEMMGEI